MLHYSFSCCVLLNMSVSCLLFNRAAVLGSPSTSPSLPGLCIFTSFIRFINSSTSLSQMSPQILLQTKVSKNAGCVISAGTHVEYQSQLWEMSHDTQPKCHSHVCSFRVKFKHNTIKEMNYWILNYFQQGDNNIGSTLMSVYYTGSRS